MRNIQTITIALMLFVQSGCASDNYYRNNVKVSITPISSISGSNSNVDYYQNEKGIVLGVSNKLLVKLKDSASLANYLDEFNLTLEKTLGKNLYLLKSSDKNLTIDIANRLNEKDDVEYSHPDFIKKRMRR